MGFLGLSRKIIMDKRVNFFPIQFQEASEDFSYCLTARKHGYKIYVDGRIKLGHYMTFKRKDWTAPPETDTSSLKKEIMERARTVTI